MWGRLRYVWEGPMQTIRIFRAHANEEAAQAAAQRDLAEFEKEFPGCVHQVVEQVIHDRFAEYGVVGCVLTVLIEPAEKQAALALMWLERLNNAVMVEYYYGA